MIERKNVLGLLVNQTTEKLVYFKIIFYLKIIRIYKRNGCEVFFDTEKAGLCSNVVSNCIVLILIILKLYRINSVFKYTKLNGLTIIFNRFHR